MDVTEPLPVLDSVAGQRYLGRGNQAAPACWQPATDMRSATDMRWATDMRPGDQDPGADGKLAVERAEPENGRGQFRADNGPARPQGGWPW
jgi:hypothetical protein